MTNIVLVFNISCTGVIKMQLSSINPYIRVAMRSVISKGHSIAKRVIFDYELIYLERGEFTFIYNDKPYKCKEGDFIFIRPGISHSFQINSTDISQPHVHFDITHRPQSEKIPISFKDKQKMTESEKALIHKDYFQTYKPYPFINIEDKKEFLLYFYKIVSCDTDALTKKAFMMQLISIIIHDNFNDLLSEDEKISELFQVKDYLDAGNGLCMALDDFANTFHYSKFYLERKFKALFGVNLIEYRNKKRMEFANLLLAEHPITEVYRMVGYKSIYSFSRAYKEKYGHSPSKCEFYLNSKTKKQ